MEQRPLFPPNQKYDLSNHYFIPEAFTAEEMMWIGNLHQLYEFQTATVASKQANNEAIRKSQIKWMYLTDRSNWLYDKISGIVSQVNDMMWGFDLFAMIDDIQYTEYQGPGGHYTWHIDVGGGGINHRKVSMVVQLSDKSEYKGGELEIWGGGKAAKIPKIKGSMVLFPSYLMHRVTPVKEGLRKTLVTWFGGRSFR